ncbi:flagellar biosynthesis protein FlhB [Enterovirga rhinocerotis]|uniref:Flagellar biosynthetic protein FlhB n=1 Tax=Enterovirga rhinocerotis TaxID=1339210 RepID=A0A4V3DXP8_9HYPH|nr:flagellar biosynthesis protein FlhB [Enterovirga rhinocerotis]TDR89629.1 flagellar biosynthetic protein FlhB [Enterovirga rhinocerotis]
MAEGQEGEDKTEEPTPHRLQEAHKRGDVPKSQEVSVFLGLGALTLALMLMPVFGTGPRLAHDLKSYLAGAHLVPSDGAGIQAAGTNGLFVALRALALPLGIVIAAALAAGLVQHRPVFSAEQLTPKLSRLSPLAGLKRMFGAQGIVQFVKGIAKIALVGTLAGWVLWRERDRFESLVGQEPTAVVAVSLGLALKLLGGILALHAIITIADILFQRFSWMKRQRMTREEVKREMKEQDGNPEIKAKLRQLRQQRLRQSVAKAVPKATVVIANPTHFAVALRYESGMAAPVCVAKGVDALALRIRAIAAEHGVAVIENPPLARALHATVEIDDEIPVDHYKAVAEVIGFVLRLKRRAS